MRIRLLRSFANPDIKMRAGEIMDLPGDVAAYYVLHGKAEWVDYPKATVLKQKATQEVRETAILPEPKEISVKANKIKAPVIKKARRLAHDDMAKK
jgi:hypothetical protein